MNEKEVSEIRRRFRPDKSNISRIRGCYVSEKKEILSEFNQSLGLMPQVESEEILSIFRKTLSGSIGKNLLDIEFSTQQVLDSDEHRLLMNLRDSSLEDDEAVSEFYDRVIKSITMEGNYIIMLCCDKYDVFSYSKDGKKEDDSSTVFSYVVCSICPVKMTKPMLSYFAYENAFRNISANSVVGSPELGFMFPSFDDRASNIYNALYYTRNTEKSQSDFVEAVFKREAPMPADIQKETFQSVLSETVSDSCSYDMVQAIHEQVCGMVEEHKMHKDEEPLMVSKMTFKGVFQSCGVEESRMEAFEEKYDFEFGENAAIRPQNIVDTKKFEVCTADVTIKVNPERSDLVTTQIIDGKKYILVRAEDYVKVNGVTIHIS